MARRQARTTLPSGLSFTLSIARPDRPWEIEGSGDAYVVRRPHLGDSSSWDYFCAQHSTGPTVLSRRDAEALVTALNLNVSSRATRSEPGRASSDLADPAGRSRQSSPRGA